MKPFRLLLGSAALLLVGILSCSGNDEKKPDAAGISLDQLEHGLAKAYCGAIERCDLGDLSLWVSSLRKAGQCEDVFARLWWGEDAQEFSRLRRAVGEGLLRYDPAAAARCVDELETLCPHDGDPADWCQEAFQGNFAAACVSKFVWSPNPDCPDTAEPPAPTGWRAPSAEGESCCGLPCGAGLFCSYQLDETGVNGTSVCRPRLAVGAVCTGSASACESGSSCGAEVCEPIPAASVDPLQDFTRPDAGEPCQSSDFFREGLCGVGLACARDAQTCSPPRPDGNTCLASSECESGQCLATGTAPLNPDSGECGQPVGCGAF